MPKKRKKVSSRIIKVFLKFLDDLPILLSKVLAIFIFVMVVYNTIVQQNKVFDSEIKGFNSTQNSEIDCDEILNRRTRSISEANNYKYDFQNGSLVYDPSRWVIIAFSK